MDNQKKKYLKPADFVENALLSSILNGEYPSGSLLPPERELAEQMGVTRPTLRETLQRLSREGWITIRHGKATIVNDFLKNGGMGILGTLSKYPEYLPENFIESILEFRSFTIPNFAALAAENKPDVLIEFLKKEKDLKDNSNDFTAFDWNLQFLMVRLSKNPISIMMHNDFTEMFLTAGFDYFSNKENRNESRKYFKAFLKDLESGGKNVKVIVRDIMDYALKSWIEMKKSTGSK